MPEVVLLAVANVVMVLAFDFIFATDEWRECINFLLALSHCHEQKENKVSLDRPHRLCIEYS
jgi:hypothetical protein